MFLFKNFKTTNLESLSSCCQNWLQLFYPTSSVGKGPSPLTLPTPALPKPSLTHTQQAGIPHL